MVVVCCFVDGVNNLSLLVLFVKCFFKFLIGWLVC